MPFGPYWSDLPQAGGKAYVDSAAWNQVVDNFPNWKGDVNGGGHKLSNVILEGSGGFEFTPSPVTITQGASGETIAAYTAPGAPNPLLRWTAGKDATTEAAGNVGSNFAIKRYANDGTTLLGTPLSIARSTGIISLGQQLWTANVNGGGFTLSNAVIAGYANDPTTTKGDLIVRGASALARIGVAGASDGWVLTVDAASASGLKWAAQAGGVPTTRQIIAGTGLTGGGDLSADRTLSVVANTTVQKHRISLGGSLAGTRQEFNFINGAGIAISMTDDNANDRVNVTITNTGGGGSGGSQTPWASDIDAFGYKLYNAGNIGIGVATAAGIPISNSVAGRAYLTIKGASDAGILELATGAADADAALGGQIAVSDPVNSQTDKRLFVMSVIRQGATANNRGSTVAIYTRGDNVTSVSERMRIDNMGRVGIGATPVNLRLTMQRLDDQVNLRTYANTDTAGFDFCQVQNFPTTNGFQRVLDIVAGGANAGGNIRFVTQDVSAAGATAMLINSQGRVGIGTTNPGTLLTVKSGAAAATGGQAVLALDAVHDGASVGSGAVINFYAAGAGPVAQIRSVAESAGAIGLSLRPYGAGALPDALHVTSNGNVAIGCATAPSLLTVSFAAPVGTTPTNQKVFIGGVGATASDTVPCGRMGLGIDQNQDYGAYLAAMFYTGSITGAVLGSRHAGADFPTIYLRQGNVGIARTNPAAILHVVGNTVDPSVTTDATGNMILQSGAVQLAFGVLTTGPFSSWLQSRANNGSNPICLQPSGGNVGVGFSSSPARRLHVQDMSANTQLLLQGSSAQKIGMTFQVDSTEMWNQYVQHDGTYYTMTWDVQGTKYMYLRANGCLGIGAVPEQSFYKLQVQGGRGLFSAASESYAVGLRYNAGGSPMWLGVDASGSFNVSEPGGAWRMQLTTTGNLSVYGTITANGVLLGGGGVTTQADGSAGRPYPGHGGAAGDTAYQNTTGKPMYVVVRVNGASGYWEGYADPSNPPTQVVASCGMNGTGSISVSMGFWVPVNWYYKAKSVSGGSLAGWTEWY